MLILSAPISTHTLTWSVTCPNVMEIIITHNFNSHAHVERDTKKVSQALLKNISTHTLTWSVTNLLHNIRCQMPISTHTLTWSVTVSRPEYCFFFANFNSHAHVERDDVSPSTSAQTSYFNSHAHVERDSWLMVYVCYISYFNSHAHVERD